MHPYDPTDNPPRTRPGSRRDFLRAASLLGSLGVLPPLAAQSVPSWRDATPDEARLDAIAFDGFDAGIASGFGDVQSLVVVLQGRTAYQYHRDGNPDALRDTQSVTKSALALLVGTALRQGQIASLERPVHELMPPWQALNADPRAAAITLRHLLSMTAGFAIDDAAGTTAPLAPAAAWARPLQAAPGQRFAYDNSLPALVAAILEHVTGRPLADLAREQLVAPLGLREPGYARGLVQLRTVDMARLGQLVLQDGRWAGQPLLPEGFVQDMVRPRSAGGPPVGLPYGLFWWVASPTTYFASGYGGQLIWVHAPLNLVVAVTSTVSPASMQRGQALQLVRGRVFEAARRRLGSAPSS